ncbi:ABC-type lipoprotein export system ATPase subunit [Diaminobutyricimonas aerilata]|uniref:ABC-type lipoprotein export system ATPase subunit n=1 Tax=Diaminobutyricimonas aerilata TaxID=1162967 RepID=A0A2M9CJ25_9MICO|nr:ABC transporter ATP-binding protein [Diaminobutyricimonas aerilata]PJJ71894.1 ABC-type lipoprotein export system ATPase subunit [Diaminobutyricimonas aerilata]
MTASADDEPDILCSELVRIFVAKGIEVQALQGLGLRVDRGELVALVGASGSGKSTLLTILAGLDTPTAGAARVAGHDLIAMRGAERLRYRRESVGFIWQQTARNLLPYLSAEENIAFAHTVAGVVPRRRRAEVADGLLDLLRLGDLRARRPHELSGGQQQRVAIAVALANSPRVLLADEPTGELDEATSADVLATMEEVNRERGVTTLIVTHDPAVADHVDRTVRIRDGRTSTEVLRRTETDHTGQEVRVAEEFAVLDAVGRMQLPAEFTRTLGLRERVRLSLEPDHVAVRPGQRSANADVPVEGSDG